MDILPLISDIVKNLGFPIVCCGALFWYMVKQRDMHKEETDKMTEALNNNTLVLEKLLFKIGDNKNDN